MKPPLKIAIAGLGTVGAGVLKLIAANGDLIAKRCGRPLFVVAVGARDRGKDRGVALGAVKWYDDAERMAEEADAEVVVELIGGADGIAKRICEAAIARGRHVVTANKALLANHGTALARAAEAKGVALCYEASVAGGIPIVKALREGLGANRLSRIYGILNGTCNYILTVMRKTGRVFEDVLAEAQKLGYAEADPGLDVDGIDAAHKLAILAGVAFGTEIRFDAVHVEGIRHVSPLDIEYAKELGYRIKLLGIARLTEHGLEQRVHPCMVPVETPIAHVEDVFNAVVADGNFVGNAVFEGRGAGAGPTASAVVADLMDIARGDRPPTFGVPMGDLAVLPTSPMERHRGAYYIRLMVVDRPGVIADVTAALRDEQVSLESMLQRGRRPGEMVPVVLVTHPTEEAAMNRALRRIGGLGSVLESPRVIRIEEL
ncbi:MAG: homoserine dehydrogenase [Proteobacteria bacterium]|nr:homoserine dehydrogenase [Pseudomonadota bacterium]